VFDNRKCTDDESRFVFFCCVSRRAAVNSGDNQWHRNEF